MLTRHIKKCIVFYTHFSIHVCEFHEGSKWWSEGNWANKTVLKAATNCILHRDMYVKDIEWKFLNVYKYMRRFQSQKMFFLHHELLHCTNMNRYGKIHCLFIPISEILSAFFLPLFLYLKSPHLNWTYKSFITKWCKKYMCVYKRKEWFSCFFSLLQLET